MRGALRFVTALILGLGLVAWGAGAWLEHTTRAWFDNDIGLRAELAVAGAHQALLLHWHKSEPKDLQGLLSEITRDERILAAAACDADGRLITQTGDFPRSFSCSDLLARVRPADGSAWHAWKGAEAIVGGPVHVSAMPLADGSGYLGVVALLHDLSYVERREAQGRRLLLVAFSFLALAASVVTILAGRIARQSWSSELRRSLRTGRQVPEFQPILRDVRELVARIVEEQNSEPEQRDWTPQRLKATLERHLHGEKIVIVANREPYIHVRGPDGTIEVRHPASGLVTALEPVMRACSGVWVAHGSGSADREASDAHGRVSVPPEEASYVLRRVWLSEAQERGYYYGFSNEGLWPLSHVAHTRPVFRSEDWEQYRRVNELFVEAVCEEVDSDDPIVLVQDYHFALVPRLLRERLPRATVITFWHIPWPNAQRLGICPWRTQLLDGLLGSSIVGFHTQLDCNNFVDAVERFMEARIDREKHAVVQQGRATLVRPYPISLEWPSRWANEAPPVETCRTEVFAELGLRTDMLLGVGVDRLDYTKGVEERLLAVERLLERFPEFQGRFTFVQIAAPSRTAIERYQRLNDSIEALADRINQRYGTGDYRPIVLRRAHHEPPAVFKYYRAADVCYVSSLHDGMNLVAKEFVAAREDERGVLVLSQFTGAARELTEALIVNPYDLDEASRGLAAALRMSADEQAERMRAMRSFVASFNVYRWAGRMLVDAARLRSRDRLTGRITDITGAFPTQ